MDSFLDIIFLQVFSDGQTIISEGDNSNCFYIIKRGEVAIFKGSEFVCKIGENEMFGEQAVLYGAVRSASIVAVGHT